MQHSVPFRFAGHDWEAKIEELPATIELDLENMINEGGLTAAGTAKNHVIKEGVKALYKGRKPQNLRANKDALRLPPDRDPETRESLLPSLLRAVVKHNDFLGYVDPFKGVFGAYLPGDADEENPTETEGTSPSGSITSLPTPQSPAQTPQTESAPSV